MSKLYRKIHKNATRRAEATSRACQRSLARTAFAAIRLHQVHDRRTLSYRLMLGWLSVAL